MMSPVELLKDPVLKAPLIGTILMSISSSIVGVLMFVRKQSLVGEALSHAAYPGIILGIMLASCFTFYSDEVASLSILVGAFFSCLAGAFVIDLLTKRYKVSSDAALCYVLSAFLGLGVLFSSLIQHSHAMWYRKINMFLYGQAITMNMHHVELYLILALLTIGFVLLFFPSIKVLCFDRDFSKITGINSRLLDGAVIVLLSLSIVMGIRSVGVVLMTAMLLAPAIAARQISRTLVNMMITAVVFGALSAYLGVYASCTIGDVFLLDKALPTGPSIVLVSSFICLVSLFFAPKRGVIIRFIRRYQFTKKCLVENLLKAFWRKGPQNTYTFKDIRGFNLTSSFKSYLAVLWLKRQGFVQGSFNKGYSLTQDGAKRASYIIRLHRLWEVYLADHLGFSLDKIHHNAEEMEHIITPDVEKTLTEILANPDKDPHKQPIPHKEFL